MYRMKDLNPRRPVSKTGALSAELMRFIDKGRTVKITHPASVIDLGPPGCHGPNIFPLDWEHLTGFEPVHHPWQGRMLSSNIIDARVDQLGFEPRTGKVLLTR